MPGTRSMLLSVNGKEFIRKRRGENAREEEEEVLDDNNRAISRKESTQILAWKDQIGSTNVWIHNKSL